MARRIMDPNQYPGMTNDELDRTINELQDVVRYAVNPSTSAEARIYLVVARHEQAKRAPFIRKP